MSNNIVFTSVKSNADNRLLEKDDNGYYKVTLGALNMFNSAGEFYTINGVRDMFINKSSSLQRRIKNGFLKSEVGHPNLQPGMSKEQFFNRNLRIEETNTCMHIRDLILVDTNESSGGPDGSNIILVQGWVKPSGPKGDFLQKALDNPDENVAFSVRSFTKNSVVKGVVVKQIVQLITYDYVTEPGISVATKWKKLGIESMDLCDMDLDVISSNEEIDECYGCSLENNDERLIVEEIISNTATTKNNSIIDSWIK